MSQMNLSLMPMIHLPAIRTAFMFPDKVSILRNRLSIMLID